MCPCGHGSYTQKILCASAWSTGKSTRSVGRSRIEWAMQRTQTLPEQSSYLTFRPQRGSACPRLGWTWRSMAPSCWWSGKCIVLQREGGKPMIVLRKMEGHTMQLCRQGLSSCDTDISVYNCINSAEVWKLCYCSSWDKWVSNWLPHQRGPLQ